MSGCDENTRQKELDAYRLHYDSLSDAQSRAMIVDDEPATARPETGVRCRRFVQPRPAMFDTEPHAVVQVADEKKLQSELENARTQLATSIVNERRAEVDRQRATDRAAHLEQEVATMRTQLAEQQRAAQQSTLLAEHNQLQARSHDLSNQLEQQRELLAKLRIELETTLRRCQVLVEEQSTQQEQHRRLLNDLIDAKGQVRTMVRLRSLTPTEVVAAEIIYPAENSIQLNQVKYGRPVDQLYQFSKVFRSDCNQDDVYKSITELVQCTMLGKNVSILAYGQTGSGKTYTMIGTADRPGIVPRTVAEILRNAETMRLSGWEVVVSIAAYEVYKEHTYDLLNRRNKIDVTVSTEKTPAVKGLTFHEAKSQQQVESILLTAAKNRTTSATIYNAYSSRSHSFTQLQVRSMLSQTGERRESSIFLVDLAGSESSTGLSDEQKKESSEINKSLGYLRSCVLANATNTQARYRDSKLTILLMDSLGAGSSKTLLIAMVCPSIDQLHETERTLKFAYDACPAFSDH